MAKKLLIVFVLLFSCFFLVPHTVSDVSAAKAKKCPALKPSTPPILSSATPGNGSITLTWVETPNPVTNYVLQYSTSPYGMEYGSPDIGGKGTTSYTVSGLQNGVKYYFKIRGVYECQPGKLSNRITATPGTILEAKSQASSSGGGVNLSLYKPVLGASTSAAVKNKGAITPKAAPIKNTCLTCKGLSLLGAEAFLLAIFFYFSNRISMFKKSASVVIPLGAYIVFIILNGACVKNAFWCKYFIPLDIIIYVLFVISNKYGYIFKKLGVFGHRLNKKNSN